MQLLQCQIVREHRVCLQIMESFFFVPEEVGVGRNAQAMWEQAYDCLRKGILMSEYKPGEWLREQELSQKLGVSRIPLREAFRKLEQERLVELIPNRGARVTEVFTDDLSEIYDARIFVESRISRNAAERITESEIEDLRKIVDAYSSATDSEGIIRYAQEFHEAIFTASRSEGLVAIIRLIGSLIVRIRHYNHLNPARRSDSLQEHRAIYDALAQKDPDLAEEATRLHLESSKAFSLAQMSKESSHKPARRVAWRSLATGKARSLRRVRKVLRSGVES